MKNPPRILLFGAIGQVGARLQETLGAAGCDVVALDRAACDFAKIDQKKIDVTVRAVKPQLVINAAAYTAVDQAESEPELARRINAHVPGWIAHAAHAIDAPFIHFSTDYVFDGVRGAPYAEDAPARPMNVYGQTKYEGEQAVLAAHAHVFRLQWVVDHRGKNFVLTMRRLLQEKNELRVVADQLGAPSFARHIARAVTQAVPLILDGALPSGIHHLTAGGYTSWHGLGCAIAEHIGSTARIHPITSEEYKLPAVRPQNTQLDCNALAAYGIAMPHWRDGLAALLDEERIT